MDKTILILGGSGKLGKEVTKSLNKIKCNFIAPTHTECDITNFNSLENIIKLEKPNIIFHSAGLIDTEKCETDRQLCLDVNVIGTYNIIKCCRKYNIRLVFMSSEYVFSGEEEKYSCNSAINPKNIYGLSKGCGELMVKTLDDYLIIRSPFIRSVTFPYEFAFNDQFTSRQYVHQIVDDIIDYIFSSKRGIYHIVGKYQSVYELALETNSNVKPISTPEKLREVLPMKLNLI